MRRVAVSCSFSDLLSTFMQFKRLVVQIKPNISYMDLEDWKLRVLHRDNHVIITSTRQLVL